MKIPASQKGNIPVFILLFIGLLVILLAYYKFSPLIYSPTAQNTQPQTETNTSSSSASLKKYESKDMNLYIEYPDYFKLDDTGITLILRSKEEEITISRNGTQFPNLKDYLQDYDSKRKLSPSGEKNITINGYPSLVRKVKFIPENIEEKVYYILAKNAVYIISSSPSLYPTLDQIAQSFKYIP